MMWFSQRPSISVNDMKLYVKHLHQTVCQSFNNRYLIAPLLPLLPQVSLLEYRKRKQGSSRDSDLAGSSSSLGGTPTRPGSHYSQDSHHPHCHQQMQPPASQHSSYSSSAHTFSIPQIDEVNPPDHQGSSVQSRRQDSNNQWWEVQNDGSLHLKIYFIDIIDIFKSSSVSW